MYKVLLLFIYIGLQTISTTHAEPTYYVERSIETTIDRDEWNDFMKYFISSKVIHGMIEKYKLSPLLMKDYKRLFLLQDKRELSNVIIQSLSYSEEVSFNESLNINQITTTLVYESVNKESGKKILSFLVDHLINVYIERSSKLNAIIKEELIERLMELKNKLNNYETQIRSLKSLDKSTKKLELSINSLRQSYDETLTKIKERGVTICIPPIQIAK